MNQRASGDTRDRSIETEQALDDDSSAATVPRLSEPTDTGQKLGRLRTKRAALPFVFDDGKFLQLHFTMRFTQSRMNLRKPFALSLDYTRRMMACLLFQPEPMHVDIVGLGGGSLTKFCYRELPQARVTTIEIDQTVIGMARLFRVPAPSERLSIVHADAAEYFQAHATAVDLVLVDGCDKLGIAQSLTTEQFYISVRDRLCPGGVMAVNLAGTVRMKDAVQQTISSVFGGRILVMKVVEGGNRIVLAFKDEHWPPDWDEIKRRAPGLVDRHRLEFEEYADQMARWHRRHGRKIGALAASQTGPQFGPE